MHKRFFQRILGLAILVLGIFGTASAFDTSRYATNSKLATGHWVKISVPEDGVYQITGEELAEMGFSDVNAVRVYGTGGHMISEIMDGTYPDDLVSVPAAVINGKLCFYGLGPVSLEMIYPRRSDRYFTRTINAYATAGCYFLTNDGSAANEVASRTSTVAHNKHRNKSHNVFYHEKELMSMSLTGKDLLGEKLENGSYTVDYSMPGIVEGDTLTIKVCEAAKITGSSGKINATLNDTDQAPFLAIEATIYAPADEMIYYNTKSPVISIVPTVHKEEGTVTTSIVTTGTLSNAYLDYILMTYSQQNDMQYSRDGQLRMTVANLSRSDAIDLAGANQNTVLWDVTSASDPKVIALADSAGTAYFVPGYDNAASCFIAFNPNDELKKISAWENVENQDIHGTETPNLVIITNKNLLSQAERLAQFHRNHDGFKVLVVTQEQVFNEFSSGTPDAMAYRLMNKMFYDRNNMVFKNVLLLGGGSYDNRNLVAKREYNILTYQSDNSYNEAESYVSDDFFGMMDDGSGYNVASALTKLGIGRITSSSIEEARTDIDKIENYVLHPDFGPWRNNTLYTADADDQNDGMHAFQAEGIENLVINQLGTNMASAKVYVSQYPRTKTPGVTDENQTSIDGNVAMTNRINEGQYFMTYVGHAGTTNFTKKAHLWSSSDANNMVNPHLPIMTTACCNVARYDSDKRGIAEIMFHNPNGGVIATLTSSRSVYASYNDDLNQAWCRAMFSFEQNGYMPTLGEVVMKAKQAFGTITNYNKMSFLLLGDPAIKVNYPKPYFAFNTINGIAATDSVNISPLQQVEVRAQVLNPDKTTVNTSFNGDGYVTIYGEKRFQKNITQKINYNSVTREIYYPREVIAQVKGRVVNGEFVATVTMPQFYAANDSISVASIKLYAHQDDSEEMVNGVYDKAVLTPYNEEVAITDDVPPVINTMFINDADEFAANPRIKSGDDVVLHITASDNVAFNVQSGTPVGMMKLILDEGSKSFTSVKDFAQFSNDSKDLSIDFPLTGLDMGNHTLQYTVFDIAGNSATQTIEFTIENDPISANVTVKERPAVDEATFSLINQTFAGASTIYIKVLNTVGDIVYSTTTETMPFVWDLKGNNGERVEAGVYRYYVSYEVGNQNGGTDIGTLIVVDPVLSNR